MTDSLRNYQLGKKGDYRNFISRKLFKWLARYLHWPNTLVNYLVKNKNREEPRTQKQCPGMTLGDKQLTKYLKDKNDINSDLILYHPTAKTPMNIGIRTST